MPTFTSEAALRAYVQERAEIAMRNTAEKMYMVIKKYLNKFYGEYNPVEYIRTEKLLNSLVKVSGGLHAEVYFDYGGYKKGIVQIQSSKEDNNVFGYANWSDAKILSTAMHGSHGGYTSGTAIWDESMAELGDIVEMVAQELRKAGLPVV